MSTFVLMYVGPNHIQGVPARHLTEAEAAKYGGVSLLLKYPDVFALPKKEAASAPDDTTDAAPPAAEKKSKKSG